MSAQRLMTRGCLVASCILLLAACVARHPSGIAPSTGPVTPTYTTLGPVGESDCAYWALILPLGGKTSTHEIISRLVKDKGADALVGVTVEERLTSFILFGNDCTVVKGTAVKNVK